MPRPCVTSPILFQLTTSQGGRLPFLLALEWYEHFNSRPRKEVDGYENSRISLTMIFQLTTSQGGRREGAEVGHISIIFQLTTSQGGRHVPQALVQLLLQYFNSRPRKEVDLYATASALTTQIFQLTTSQGGRQQFLRKKFSFQNHFLCSLHIIYSYYINIVFFSTLFLAKSSFFLVRIP